MKNLLLSTLFFSIFCLSNPDSGTNIPYYHAGKFRVDTAVVDSSYLRLTEYFENGGISEIKFISFSGFNLTNKYVYFHQNGSVAALVSYVNGKIQGPFCSYYPDGKIRERGCFFNFFKTGIWDFYPEAENVSSERTYHILSKADSINIFEENDPRVDKLIIPIWIDSTNNVFEQKRNSFLFYLSKD